MTDRPEMRGQVNAALRGLVGEGLLSGFRTNLKDSHRGDWVPEVSLLIPEGLDLATVLERVDAALLPCGPVMLTWEWALESSLSADVPPQRTRGPAG